MKLEVKVGISNRHVHLTKEVYDMLFDNEPTKRNDLYQPGEFATNETLTIKTECGTIENVRLLAPFREYNQIEICKKDAIKLGINPPVRRSGDLSNSEYITLVTNKGSVKTNGCIIAERHLHINPMDALKYGLSDKESIQLVVDGIKGGIMNAFVKVCDNHKMEVHIDTDDAAAFMLDNDSKVTIVK